VWERGEYEKLPPYDWETFEQPLGLFMCHSGDATTLLCAGWVSCHDMDNNLAVRFAARRVDPMVYDYVSPVPLFGSGRQAAAHGISDYGHPGPEALRVMGKVLARQHRAEVHSEMSELDAGNTQ
jgi:hypothetical protein